MRVTLIALVTTSLLLGACGQKGPLYLPQDQTVDNAATEKQDKARSDAVTEKPSTY